jgi:hypothetical protein
MEEMELHLTKNIKSPSSLLNQENMQTVWAFRKMMIILLRFEK